MILRDYQQEAIDALHAWWATHDGAPIMDLPTGAGKSVIIAELVRDLFARWPDHHPRTLVIVPSKELAEQNAEKLASLLPDHVRVGFYSASIGRKEADADVIVATIGSVAKKAHLLGNVKCVVIDECHLVNPDGAGMYRRLIDDLRACGCTFRAVGLTATPFRGNGIWLTDGKVPLFSGIAFRVPMQRLIDAGHLARLVPPFSGVTSRMNTDGLSTRGGDYDADDLADRFELVVEGVADEALALAGDRGKWLAFTPTVATAWHMRDALQSRGIASEVVCGETPKPEREALIAAYRAGSIRCLVTVLALATGFDVPDVDCIIWCRPTISPVLYVQGAGRGLRIAEGKTDCLWLDFTDTTERLGPVDAIRGRARSASGQHQTQNAGKVCDQCGDLVVPASLAVCPACGFVLRIPQPGFGAEASDAAVMSSQVDPAIKTHEVTEVRYRVHAKPGKQRSLRVDYWAGLCLVASEWVCLEHAGYARRKAEAWWLSRSSGQQPPATVDEAIAGSAALAIPVAVTVDESGQYNQIIKQHFGEQQ